MHSTRALFAFLFALGLTVGSCGHGDHEHGEDTAEVPVPYAGMSNPMAGDPVAAEQGSVLYVEKCAECHGDNGHGDGEQAAELDPMPADFHEHTLDHPDDYLFWRVAEGGDGDPVESDMPAWKTLLTEQQIWQVITHMREMHAD